MATAVNKLVTGFVIVVAIILVCLIFIASRSGPAPPPLPNPNGYEGLLRAASMLKGNNDYTTESAEELRADISKNAEAFNEARKALKQESRVKLDYSSASPIHVDEISGLKHLARVFIAEGRLAEMDHHPLQATHAYLDVINLGHKAERGGTIIDSMIGVAIEAMGCAALEKLYPQLSAQDSREAAIGLEAIESTRESTRAILDQERAWAHRTYGLRGQVSRLFMFKQIKAMEQRWAARKTAQEIRSQRLLVKIAGRAYELEKGESVKSLTDLVPGYLKTVPPKLLAPPK